MSALPKGVELFSTASEAIGMYARPFDGAPHWRKKIGIVKSITTPNRANPLVRVELRWDQNGNPLPSIEEWDFQLFNLATVPGFAKIRKDLPTKDVPEQRAEDYGYEAI